MNIIENVQIDDFKKNWSCLETLLGSSCITAIYLIFVLKILPDVMKHRKPYDLKQVLLIYNMLQVSLSAYTVYLFSAYAVTYSMFPTTCWFEVTSNMTKTILRPITANLVAKHLDLLDTVFFVLRKKDNQVTFLHIYHHSITLTWSWLHFFYFPSDIYLFPVMLNCFVHVVMYTYYALSSLGPEFAKYIWWKKYLTKFQLAQFIVIICYLIYQHKTSPCPTSSFSLWYAVTSIFIFFLLFMNFYIRSYNAEKTNKVN